MGRFASLAALREVFTNPNLRELQLAWAGFMLADSAYAVALAVLAYQTGGAAAVGIVMVCRLLPAALATPVVTLVGDRHSGERVLAVSLVGRSAVIAMMGAFALSDLPIAVLYVLVALDTIPTTAFRPTNAALVVPASRSAGELSAANSATAMIENVSVLCGPLLAAGLLAASNETSVFAAAAILLLAAAVAAARIRIPGQSIRTPRKGDEEDAGGFRDELVAGARVLASVPQSGLVLGLFSAQALVKGMWMVFMPIVALELLNTGSSGVGALQAALGAGGLIGSLGTLALVGRRRLAPPFALGLALWGPPIALIALGNGVLALALVGVLGAGKGLVYVAGLSLLQRMMAKVVLGRVLGLLQTLALVATGVGAFAAAPLIEAVGLGNALIVSSMLMPVLIVASWSRFGAIDRGAVGREREIAALRQVPLLSALPPLELEQLAAATVPLSVPAGSEVIRQGDRGDRFYIVADGVLDVFVDERLVATLGPGGSFGEIALVRDVPRTATVTARTEVELFAIERDPFLAALTGRPAALLAAEVVADTREKARPLDLSLAEVEPAAILAGEAVDVLRRVPTFAALSDVALDRLATRLTGLRTERGAHITRQGDYGDRFFILVDGSAEVVVDGERVATLDPGDSFGEVALVNDVPRSATVTALAPVALLAVERADFLEAVGDASAQPPTDVDGRPAATPTALKPQPPAR